LDYFIILPDVITKIPFFLARATASFIALLCIEPKETLIFYLINK